MSLCGVSCTNSVIGGNVVSDTIKVWGGNNVQRGAAASSCFDMSRRASTGGNVVGSNVFAGGSVMSQVGSNIGGHVTTIDGPLSLSSTLTHFSPTTLTARPSPTPLALALTLTLTLDAQRSPLALFLFLTSPPSLLRLHPPPPPHPHPHPHPHPGGRRRRMHQQLTPCWGQRQPCRDGSPQDWRQPRRWQCQPYQHGGWLLELAVEDSQGTRPSGGDGGGGRQRAGGR